MLALFNPYFKVYILFIVYIVYKVYKVYSSSYCIFLKLVIEGLKTEPKSTLRLTVIEMETYSC